MTSANSAIDLSQLDPPEVVEEIDYEVILSAGIQDFYARMQALGVDYPELRESDPAYKLAEAFAYREMLLRQRANSSAKAVLLAYATGSDLEHKAAERNLQRKVISEATSTQDAVLETDDALRTRVQLAPEGYTTAGSEGSYIFHGMNADVRVKDIQPDSPSAGVVNLYVLSSENNGQAQEDLLNAVNLAVNQKQVRPLTDQVHVFSASIVEYEVEAVLEVEAGPDSDVILQKAQAELASYTTQSHALSKAPALSGIYQALHRPGVSSVELLSPTQNFKLAVGQAAYCTAINVSIRTLEN